MHIKSAAVVLFCMVLAACDKGAVPPSTASPAVAETVVAPATGSGAFARWAAGAPSVLNTGSCNFDRIDGQDRDGVSFTLAQAALLPIVGWAVASAPEASVGDGALLMLTGADGARFVAPTVQQDRPDVGAYLHNLRLSAGGFTANAALIAVPKGAYTLSILIKSGHAQLSCGITKQIMVV
jgi:hypothetical protein